MGISINKIPMGGRKSYFVSELAGLRIGREIAGAKSA
jgi:hypothetical protein